MERNIKSQGLDGLQSDGGGPFFHGSRPGQLIARLVAPTELGIESTFGGGGTVTLGATCNQLHDRR
jgi:hypothetical protein